MDTNKLEIIGVIAFDGITRNGLRLHPDGQHLIYPMGNKVTVKNIKTTEQFFLDGHKNVISALCVSPGGNFIASGQVNHHGFKAMVIVWDFEKREMKGSYEIHKVRVEDVCFTGDERYLISLGGIDDGCIVVWDVQTKLPLCGIAAGSYTGNATLIARTNISERYFITTGNGTIKLWHIESKDRKLYGTDVKIGKIKRVINCIAVDENDRNVYCGTTSGDVIKARLNIDLENRELEQSIKCPVMIGCYSKIPRRRAKVNSNVGEVYAGGVKNILLLTENKMIVGTGDGTVESIEIARSIGDKAKKNLLVVPCIITHHSGNVCASVTSIVRYGNDFLLVGTALCEIHEIELSSFRSRLIVTCHTAIVHDVAFPRNSGKVFATAGKNDIRVWKLATQKELLRITVANFSCSSLCFDRNGGSIISAWNDGAIRRFASNSGKLLYSIDRAHTKPVSIVTITNDDDKLLSGGCDGQIRLWNGKSKAGQLLTVLKEHRGPITSLHVSPDDQSFISSSTDGTCVVWDMGSLKQKFTLRGNTMYMATCFASNGAQILTCGTDRKIAYWESLDGSLVREIEGSASGTLNTIDISQDGRYFLTGSDDCIVKLWQYRTANIVRFSLIHAAAITSCAFAPDGKFAVTASADGAMIIWKY